MWRFFDFSRWRQPLSWIFEITFLTAGRVTVLNFVAISQTVAEISHFLIFQDNDRRRLGFYYFNF